MTVPLGHPAKARREVLDFGAMGRCGSCELAPRRASRGGNAEKVREMQKCEKKRCGDGAVQGVCLEKHARRAHNLETRGEFAPPPPEITHPDHADHDNEMPDQNDTAEDSSA